MKQRGAGLAWMLVGMLAFVQGAWAQSPGAVRKQVEGSMLVTGMITIRADGGVAAVELDKQDRLPEGIAPFVTQVATSWRFEPVLIEGVARQVRTRMSARLLAKPTGDGVVQLAELRQALLVGRTRRCLHFAFPQRLKASRRGS